MNLSLRPSRLLATLFTVLALGFTLEVQAQALEGTNVKEYGRPGYPKVTVFVWGDANTGIWAVEEGTDLLEFLSVSARPQLSDRSAERRTISSLKIYREGQTDQDPFYEERLEVLFSRRVSYPAMKERDIIVIETRTKRRFTWRDISQITGTVSSVVGLYFIIDRFNRD